MKAFDIRPSFTDLLRRDPVVRRSSCRAVLVVSRLVACHVASCPVLLCRLDEHPLTLPRNPPLYHPHLH